MLHCTEMVADDMKEMSVMRIEVEVSGKMARMEEKELSRRRGGRGGGRRAAYDPPAVTTGGREGGCYLLTSKYSRLSTSTAKQQGRPRAE